MATMVQLPLQYQPHQLFRRRTHVPEPLAEGNHGEAIILQRLHHHGGVPPVISDFFDVEPLTQLQDELLDKTVMDNVSLCSMQETLPLPGMPRVLRAGSGVL